MAGTTHKVQPLRRRPAVPPHPLRHPGGRTPVAVRAKDACLARPWAVAVPYTRLGRHERNPRSVAGGSEEIHRPASRQVGTLRVESRGGGHPPVSTLGTRDSADTWRPLNGGGPAVLPGELRSPRGPAFATAVAPRPRSSKANPATPHTMRSQSGGVKPCRGSSGCEVCVARQRRGLRAARLMLGCRTRWRAPRRGNSAVVAPLRHLKTREGLVPDANRGLEVRLGDVPFWHGPKSRSGRALDEGNSLRVARPCSPARTVTWNRPRLGLTTRRG